MPNTACPCLPRPRILVVCCWEFRNFLLDRSGGRIRDARFSLSDTRLEFRTVKAVKHHQRDLPLPDYLAALPPRPQLQLSEYLVAHLTTTSVSRRFSLRGAARAAMKGHVFSDCSPSLRAGSQQAVAIKDFFSNHRQQQLFPFTPSELNPPFAWHPFEISRSTEQVTGLALTREVD